MCEPMYKINDLKQKSSSELIDLLASMGYGSPSTSNDTRRAMVHEYGKFNGPKTFKHFAKIVVHVNNSELFDYGVRIFLQPF